MEILALSMSLAGLLTFVVFLLLYYLSGDWEEDLPSDWEEDLQ